MGSNPTLPTVIAKGLIKERRATELRRHAPKHMIQIRVYSPILTTAFL